MTKPIVIISAPSGGGKSVIAKQLVKKIPLLERVITATTRKRRSNENNGRDYFFLSKNVFNKKRKQKAFLEWALVHNEWYGTPKKALEKIYRKNKIPLLVIDVQGAMFIMKRLLGTISIFIKPENFMALQRWIARSKRGTPEEVKLRMRNAKYEIAQAFRYDHQVINRDGKLNETIRRITAIISSHIDRPIKSL